MSRVAKATIVIPAGIEVMLNGQDISVKSKTEKLTYSIHRSINIQYENNQLTFAPRKSYANGWALAGTTRSILNNMIIGVTNGFTKKLQLIGIGYRAIVKGNVINLSVGFSHSIDYQLPNGVTAECPSQTEIVLKSANKQTISQAAADLRSYRRPEPYKGKGIRYADEIVRIKEAKKK